MARARIWSYPTAAPETSCIGAMEARAAGLAVVTSDFAALSETVGHDHGVLIPFDEGLVRFEEPRAGGPRRRTIRSSTGRFRRRGHRAARRRGRVDGQHARALRGVETLRVGAAGWRTGSSYCFRTGRLGQVMEAGPQTTLSGCARGHAPRAGGLCSTTGLAWGRLSPAAIDGTGLGGSDRSRSCRGGACRPRPRRHCVCRHVRGGLRRGRLPSLRALGPGRSGRRGCRLAVAGTVRPRVRSADPRVLVPRRLLHHPDPRTCRAHDVGRRPLGVAARPLRASLSAVAGKLRIVRNGIRLYDDDGRTLFEGAERAFGERAPRCIYSSQPNRGLDVLFEVWPEIRRRAPEARAGRVLRLGGLRRDRRAKSRDARLQGSSRSPARARRRGGRRVLCEGA